MNLNKQFKTENVRLSTLPIEKMVRLGFSKNAQITKQWYASYLEIVENPCKVHAIVATALIKDGKYLKCKDSYREDPTQIGSEADQIIEIPLDPSDTSSQWNLFYQDENGNNCIDAFFLSLECFWFIYILNNYMWCCYDFVLLWFDWLPSVCKTQTFTEDLYFLPSHFLRVL